MQTTNLPLQLNTAVNGASPAPRANAAHGAGDAGQFSAMLSNELALARPPAAPAPAPAAPKQDAPASAQASESAPSDDTPAPQQAVATTDTAKNGASQAKASDKTADKADDDSDDDARQHADPANAMLALIASLQQPAAKAASAGKAKGDQAFDALGGNAGKTRRSDASQLAALQGALKSAGKDKAGAQDLSAASEHAALADSGVLLAAGDKAGATDLSAALADAGLKLGHKATLDAADLSLQQARDAARQAARQDPSSMAAAALAQTTQPAALEAAQAAAGASEQLSAQVGTDAWDKQVGQKVVYMIGNEEQTASLTLNPPDLGPMQVVLSVSNDQASVTFSSNHEEVRQALENALPRLREMMSESGIALGNATVNAGSQDQRQARQDPPARGGRNYGGVDGVAAADTAPARVTRTSRLGDNGMVDTFA